MPNSAGDDAKARGLVVNFFITVRTRSAEDHRRDVIHNRVVNDALLRRSIPSGDGALVYGANDVARGGLVRVLARVVAHKIKRRLRERIALEFGGQRLRGNQSLGLG